MACARRSPPVGRDKVILGKPQSFRIEEKLIHFSSEIGTSEGEHMSKEGRTRRSASARHGAGALLTLELVRVTERAAVSAARLPPRQREGGRPGGGDAMRRELTSLPIDAPS